MTVKVKELKKYLENYSDDEEIQFIVLDLKSGMIWQNDQINLINHIYAAVPAIGLKLHEGKPVDAEMIQAVEEDERNMEAKPEPWTEHYRERFERVN